MPISGTHDSVALDHTQPVICYGWVPSTEEFLSKINTLDWQYFRVMLYQGKKQVFIVHYICYIIYYIIIVLYYGLLIISDN